MASSLGQAGTQGVERRNKPTPALRDRVESSQDSTCAQPLPRRGLSGETSRKRLYKGSPALSKDNVWMRMYDKS